PLMALSISASVGAAFVSSSAVADMICPDWQYPHWGTCSLTQADCTAWGGAPARPSMVVTLRPETVASGVMQERMALPSKCTVHAPHSAMPQPNLVPVRPATSRTAQSRGMLGSASNVVGLPLST